MIPKSKKKGVVRRRRSSRRKRSVGIKSFARKKRSSKYRASASGEGEALLEEGDRLPLRLPGAEEETHRHEVIDMLQQFPLEDIPNSFFNPPGVPAAGVPAGVPAAAAASGSGASPPGLLGNVEGFESFSYQYPLVGGQGYWDSPEKTGRIWSDNENEQLLDLVNRTTKDAAGNMQWAVIKRKAVNDNILVNRSSKAMKDHYAALKKNPAFAKP